MCVCVCVCVCVRVCIQVQRVFQETLNIMGIMGDRLALGYYEYIMKTVTTLQGIYLPGKHDASLSSLQFAMCVSWVRVNHRYRQLCSWIRPKQKIREQCYCMNLNNPRYPDSVGPSRHASVINMLAVIYDRSSPSARLVPIALHFPRCLYDPLALFHALGPKLEGIWSGLGALISKQFT